MLRFVYRILDSIDRVDTAARALKVFVWTLMPSVATTAWVWWKGAELWQRILVFDATWIAVVLTVWFALWAMKRFGSTADVRFVLESWKEAKLYVTNRGREAEFFASIWFQGEGTGGHHGLFGHWGDATEHRIRLARGQTGMIVLGRQEDEDGGIRRWDLFASTHHNRLEHVRPLAFYRVGTVATRDAHAQVLVQVFAKPDLERPAPDVRIVFADDTAYAV